MDRRFLNGLLTAFAFLFVYYFLILPLLFPNTGRPQPQPSGKTGTAEPVRTPEAGSAAPREELLQATEPERRSGVLESDFLRVRWTSAGAAVVDLSFQFDGDWMAILNEISGPHFVLKDRTGGAPLATAAWEAEEIESGVRFRYTARAGWTITKTLRLAGERRDALEVEVQWENPEGAPPVEFNHEVAIGGVERDSPYRYTSYSALAISDGNKVEWVLYASKLKKKPRDIEVALLDWFAMKNRYFALLVAPDAGSQWERHIEARGVEFAPADGHDKKMEGIAVALSGDPMTLQAKQAKVARWTVLAGPIRADALEAWSVRLNRNVRPLLDYSGFDFLAHLILGLIGLIRAATGNYGVGIILATIVIRAVLLPLSYKGQVSMLRMSHLAPEFQRIRDRYKGNPEKLLEAQKELYREHRVNPASGCLPLLAQLPVFIAIYSVLDMSLDFRHATFLWIEDLSQPDRLVPFGREVHLWPFRLDALNLLPIVMTATWMYQSLTAPKPASVDPQMEMQRKILMFMPLIFGLICYNLASGLSLYFFVNALWSIGEQRLIRRRFDAAVARTP